MSLTIDVYLWCSYFASGTGGAGLVGAALWWELRGLGVRLGVGLSSVCARFRHATTTFIDSHRTQFLPFIIPIAYYFILPHPDQFSPGATYEDESTLSVSYTQLPNEEDEPDSILVTESEATVTAPIALTIGDKWQLAKPMLMRYMLPLCTYFRLSFRLF